MIHADGRHWGTAREIADHLGQGVTADAVRKWATRNGLTAIRMTGPTGRPEVRYPLEQAIQIEARPRLSGRGRPRQTAT